jgi:hypothetical protein
MAEKNRNVPGGSDMPNTYPMQLTQLESLYLSDSISMFTQGPPDALPGQMSPFPNLLLKIGGAVLETEQQKSAATVHFNLSELWMIREITKSSAVVGSERVGLNLLMKIYNGIRALSADADMQSVVNYFGEVIDNEPGKSEYAAQLERIKEGGELSSGGINSEIGADQGDDDDKPRNPDKNNPDHDSATAA